MVVYSCTCQHGSICAVDIHPNPLPEGKRIAQMAGSCVSVLQIPTVLAV